MPRVARASRLAPIDEGDALNRIGILGALVAITVLVSSCLGGDDADKAGGEGGSDALVLTLANPDDGPFNLDEFARQVESQSEGSVRIEFENSWRLGEVD